MKVSDLSGVIKLVSRISNPSSLTPLYRSIEIGKEQVRCCSEFGNIKIDIDDTGLTGPVLLDANAVQGAANTLPSGGDITFEEQENSIIYRCGTAWGVWNIVGSEHKIPEIDHSKYPWKPEGKLAEALVLASSACQAAAVTYGLYGISIEAHGDELYLMSSNVTALAVAVIPKGSFPFEKLTLRPPVPTIVAMLLASCPDSSLDATEDGIFIKGEWLEAHLPIGTSLEHDLKEFADKYVEETQKATIDTASVKRFLVRARTLTDKNAAFNIALRVENGKLVLSHAGIASSAEEFFLAEGLPSDLNYNKVGIPAEMLSVCLGHVNTAIFDYLKDNQLVLRGVEPNFTYVIGGGD